MTNRNILSKIFFFYYKGFKGMNVGRMLWAIILIKLFVIFVVLRIFFFPNILKRDFGTDKERSEYVMKQLTTPKN
jgi:hypothetical protein